MRLPRSLASLALLVVALSAAAPSAPAAPPAAALLEDPSWIEPPLPSGVSVAHPHWHLADALDIEYEVLANSIARLYISEPNGTALGSFKVTVGDQAFTIGTKTLVVELRPSRKLGAPFDVHAGYSSKPLKWQNVKRGKLSAGIKGPPRFAYKRYPTKPGFDHRKLLRIRYQWTQFLLNIKHES